MKFLMLAGLMIVGAPVAALDVTSGSTTLSAGDAQQLGRLSRSGVLSDWSEAKAFPGEVNATTSYAYQVIGAAFKPNTKQDIYYSISIDDPTTYAFASAYDGAYDPTAKSLNYLGDAGTSGNYFGVDALFFQVVVPRGGSLQLVLNQTTAGNFSTVNYFVQAFSDTEYNENFAVVPEPATWAMLLTGFAAIGAAARSRRRSAAA